MVKVFASAFVAAILHNQVAANGLSIDDHDGILKTAGLLAEDLMALYKPDAPGSIPGIIPGKEYYWWEGAVFMTTYINYWHLTGDSNYNDIVKAGILHQTGSSNDFMPANNTATMGNDDQCGWALAAMLAAENNFPSPPNDQPQWLQLAQTVYRDMTARIDNKTCDGGLRWQIFPFNNGYNYKNSLSNGCLLDLGARLLRYTGNSTYEDLVDDTWTWMSKIGLIKDSDSDSWAVYDGVRIESDICDEPDDVQFSINAGILAHGVAVMYNSTNGSDLWRKRLDGLVDSILDRFFPDGIAIEEYCEGKKECNTDQVTFKGQVLRWLSDITQLAPYKATKILPILKTSAKAAVDQCTGGDSGRQCGFYWAEGEFVEPDTSGVGEQMDVLAAVSNLLIEQAKPPARGSSSEPSSDDSKDGSDDQSTPSKNSNTPSNTGSQSDPTEKPGAAAREGLGAISLAVIAGSLIVSALSELQF